MSCVALILYYCHILYYFKSAIKNTWEKEVDVPPSIEDHFEPIILSKSVIDNRYEILMDPQKLPIHKYFSSLIN